MYVYHTYYRGPTQTRFPLTRTLFICPSKSEFFARLQIFLHAGCAFLHPEELEPPEKLMHRVIFVYNFVQKFFIIGDF